MVLIQEDPLSLYFHLFRLLREPGYNLEVGRFEAQLKMRVHLEFEMAE